MWRASWRPRLARYISLQSSRWRGGCPGDADDDIGDADGDEPVGVEDGDDTVAGDGDMMMMFQVERRNLERALENLDTAAQGYLDQPELL